MLFFIFNKLGDFDDRIYPIELEIEDTTDTARFASCIDLHPEIDSEIRLIGSLKKFIFQYQDIVEIYSVSAEKIINDGFSYSENV